MYKSRFLIVRVIVVVFLAACSKTSPMVSSDAEAASASSPLSTVLTTTFTLSEPYQGKLGSECDPFVDYSGKKVWRAVEPDYPIGPAFVRPPEKFSDLVDEEVVRRAVRTYGCRNRLYQHQSQELDSMLLGHDLGLTGASYYARIFANVKAGIDSLGTVDKEWGRYFVESDAAREVMRRHLKDPVNLKAEYARFKPILIGGLRTAQNPRAIKEYLGRVLPLFTQPVPKEMLLTEAAFRAVEERGPRGTDEEYVRLKQALSVQCPDYRVLQWMLRRQSEGGPALVTAWGEILSDLHSNL